MDKNDKDEIYMTQEEQKKILKEIFTLPTNPKMELKSQLKSNPKSLLDDYLPCAWKFCEWSVVFLLGYLGFSYAWIITFALLYFSRNFSSTALRPTSSERLHETESLRRSGETWSLPSWVAFPDTERVEWINTIIKKVWPNIGEISQQIAKRLVEPKIKEILHRMNLHDLSNFKLKKVDLGTIPARVGGIKVYDRNTARDEIVMDIEIIYQGDLNVTFTVQAMGCEVNQVSFRGTLRLTLKPLMNVIPLVGGFEIYFMEMPEFDYSLGRMAQLAEVPGVSNIIKSVLDNVMKRGFVWPNRFSFYFPLESVRLLEDQTYAMPQPQGVLNVSLIRARHLMKKDKHLLGGKSDPYAVLSIGEKQVSFKDRYADSTVNPEWNYTAAFPVEEVAGLHLKLEVFDYDAGSEDDFLGRTSLPVQSVVQEDISNRWVRLDDAKHGEVEMTVKWIPVFPASDKSGGMDFCVVAIYVDCCRHLASGKSGKPFSKCELSLSCAKSDSARKPSIVRRESKKWIPCDRYESYTTKPRGPSEDPVFKEGHFFLSKNPTTDSIAVQVIDVKTGLVMGTACLSVTYIIRLPDKQFTRMEWKLENTSNPGATIVLSAKLYNSL